VKSMTLKQAKKIVKKFNPGTRLPLVQGDWYSDGSCWRQIIELGVNGLVYRFNHSPLGEQFGIKKESFLRWATVGPCTLDESRSFDLARKTIVEVTQREYKRERRNYSRTIKQFNDAYLGGDREVLFLRKLRQKNVGSAAIACMIEVMNEVCLHCFDNGKKCNCTRDE